MKRIVLILSLVLALLSCGKEDHLLESPGYLMFGHFYGECGGPDCIDIFKLEQDSLLEDTLDIYPSPFHFYTGSYIELSHDKFEKAKVLINYFPFQLLNEQQVVIGQPDAGDWGGLYIEYNYYGIRKFWLIDQMKSNVPERYHNFIDKVNEIISLVK